MSFFGKYYFARTGYSVAGESEAGHEFLAGTEVGESWQPAVDVYETNKRVVILVALAGVDADDIDVVVNDCEMTICGLRRDRSRGSGKNYRQMEIHHGAFERVIPLPGMVTEAGATASLQDGLLEIILPLAQRSRRGSVVISTTWKLM